MDERHPAVYHLIKDAMDKLERTMEMAAHDNLGLDEFIFQFPHHSLFG